MEILEDKTKHTELKKKKKKTQLRKIGNKTQCTINYVLIAQVLQLILLDVLER